MNFLKWNGGYFPQEIIFLSSRIIRIDEREYANIVEYESMDKTIDHQDEGLDWLDSVEHLLEWYEDSRTDAFSGIEIDEF